MTKVKPATSAAMVPVPLAENIFAPELFVSEATFFSLTGSTLSITFTSLRFDNSTDPGTQRRVVVGRLVMPVLAAQLLAAGLYDFLANHGLDPARRPSDPAQVQ